MFIESTAIVRLHLAPIFAGGRTMGGICEKLNRYLMRYCDEIKGVIVCYSNIKLLTETGRIINECPFVHFRISAKFTAFAPVVGARLTGQVNKQSADHIGLLIYGIFNASIPAAKIRRDFEWNQETGCWVLRSTDEMVENDCELSFLVDEIMVKNEVMSMVGSLMLPTLGFVRRTAEGQVLVEQQPTVEAVVVVDKTKHKKPTDNKRKSEDSPKRESEANGDSKEERKSKKKKH